MKAEIKGSIVFVATCLVYAYYSFCQIKLGTSTLWWHLAQWFSVAGFLVAGYLLGKVKNWTWHNFGRTIGLGVIGIPAYVYFLHYLLGQYGN